MKHWNKHPEVRQRCWYKVQLKKSQTLEGQLIDVWISRKKFDTVFRELQHHPGGKFYLSIMSRMVWFEQEADAVWFKLTYG